MNEIRNVALAGSQRGRQVSDHGHVSSVPARQRRAPRREGALDARRVEGAEDRLVAATRDSLALVVGALVAADVVVGCARGIAWLLGAVML